MALPSYYFSLRPFGEIFLSGWPVLTFHHVGPRRRGARLKGLYVGAKLFARQMRELEEAGFTTSQLEAVLAPTAKNRIVITFDDGFRDVFENALAVLHHHRFQATQFLVSDLLGKTNEWQRRAGDVTEPIMDEGQVRDWVAAGHALGSHTRTHPRLTQIALEAAREEITASKKSLEDRFGIAVQHFCYPYGDWNNAVRDLVAEAGYRTACTTNAGINTAGNSPFELKRFTARYPSRKLSTLWSWLEGAGP